MLMGLDVGTTGVKAAVFDETGAMQGYAFKEISIHAGAPGIAEQDGGEVFKALLGVMRAAAEGVGRDIAAISLSVQGDAVAPFDAAYRPLAPFMLGMDYRCTPQAEAFEREFGGYALFRRTGMRPHPMNTLCKIRHISEAFPEVAAKARHYMTYADYILMRLGSDEPVIDLTMASRTMGMDISTLDWDDTLLKAAGIARGQLSAVAPSGTAVGILNATVAGETGINPRARLVTGGHDQVCAAVGAGLGAPGLALDSHGTAEVISTVMDAPMLDREMYASGFPCYAYAEPSRFFTFSLNHTGGLLLRWFVEQFCGEERMADTGTGASAYDMLLAGLSDEPSGLIVLPYLNGRGTPRIDVGMKGVIAGLTLSSTRFDVARALLEALALDMRANLEALSRAGLPVSALRCVGGGAKSPVGLQIKADVCGREVAALSVREAACLGAALIAGAAVGVYAGLSETSGINKPAQIYTPRERFISHYRERFVQFESLYTALRGRI